MAVPATEEELSAASAGSIGMGAGLAIGIFGRHDKDGSGSLDRTAPQLVL